MEEDIEIPQKQEIDAAATLKKNRKLYIINIIFILAVLIGVFVYLFSVDGKENVDNILRNADYRWVVVGIFCLIGYWIIEALSIHIPLKRLYPDQKFWDTYKVTMVGQLFNNLTPFASGGQFMEVYSLYKQGRRPSDTLSVLMMKFVLMQTGLIIFTVSVVLSQMQTFIDIFKDYIPLGVIGITLNVLLVIFLFLAGFKKSIIVKICKPFIKLGGKIHFGKHRLVKDVDKSIENFEKSVENFNKQFKEMNKQKDTVAQMLILGVLQSFLYYSITYMIYRAFGNSGAAFFQVITIQAFLMLLMTITPTPGAGLGAEGGFGLFFERIFENGTLALSMLFWRLYVFYLPIIVGTIFFIPTKRRIRKEEKIKKQREKEKEEII